MPHALSLGRPQAPQRCDQALTALLGQQVHVGIAPANGNHRSVERLLARIAKSPYADKVILKGGMLTASMAGIAQRTTMDMDATIVGMPMNGNAIESMIRDVCGTPSDDGIEYSLDRIREEDEYPGFRAHVGVRIGKIRTIVKIDITTDDSLVPGAMCYPYKPILGEEPTSVLSYATETVIAEKFETAIRRGSLDGRARDFYDIDLMPRLHGNTLDWGQLGEAIRATTAHRNSEDALLRVEGNVGEGACVAVHPSVDLSSLREGESIHRRYHHPGRCRKRMHWASIRRFLAGLPASPQHP